MGKQSKRRRVKRKLERTEGRAALKAAKKNLPPPFFKDNGGNIIAPIELVFPIVRFRNHKFETIGTGFFVHPAGGFVTARHCLYIGNTYDDNCYAIQTVKGYQHVRKIQYFEAHPEADIGMGMLRGELKDRRSGRISLRPTLPVSLTPPNINDEISTLAYPRMKIKENNVAVFPCDRYIGQILDHLPDGTGMLKSPCYVTNMEIKSGASGGPVLRGKHIIGVNSVSMDISDGGDPISFITPIQQIFDLKLKDSDGQITTVRELMASGHMDWAE